MRVTRWSETARKNLNETIAYIAADSPENAQRVRDRILATADSLARHNTGRPGRVPGTFERLVRGMPYFLIYSIDDSGILIIRLIHTAQLYPPR